MSISKGRWAEDFVANGLINAGWQILSRNYRHIGFELDILAHRGDRLVCVEVKGRSHVNRDTQHLLGAHKLRRLRQGVSHWLQMQEMSGRSWQPELWLCVVLRSERGQGKVQIDWLPLRDDAGYE